MKPTSLAVGHPDPKQATASRQHVSLTYIMYIYYTYFGIWNYLHILGMATAKPRHIAGPPMLSGRNIRVVPMVMMVSILIK